VRLATGELIDATPVNVKEKGRQDAGLDPPRAGGVQARDDAAGAHTIDAEVVEIIYMGDILRAVLKVAGSDDFVMKMRNTLGQTKLSPGQKIKVGWHPQDARALDP
jgi:putative spermidine/putrescine transport system ATP-binding protein